MSTLLLDAVAANSQAKAALSHDTIYVITRRGETINETADGLNLILTRDFTSELQFATDVADHSIPKGVKAILYDNEDWSLTPLGQRQNAVTYYEEAYRLAAGNGYQLIATPGTVQLDPQIAPYTNIIDIQSQESQGSVSTYLMHISSLVAAVKQANPNVVILSGLSTNPRAGDPTPQQLYNIAKATYPDLVDGWWLNVPTPGVACPRCNSPRPDIAVAFLQLFGSG
jgi:hypothetical protein